METIQNKSNKSFNYYWRLFATGLSFTVFGLGGIVLGIIFFPILLMIPNKKICRKIARSAIQKCFFFFIEFMRMMGVLSYQTQGFDKLKQRRGLLIISNHPTLLDVVFLIAFLDDVDCIIKKEIFKNPVMMGVVRAAGYIANDAQNPEELIMNCVDRLSNQTNLIIFPEGTRTQTGRGYQLQRGASNIALRAQSPIVPILICCTPPTLRKGERWYNIPPQKMHFSLSVQSDFPVLNYSDSNAGIAARQLTIDLTRYFSERLPNE
ncbi:lysophospholipid acyltransferase family protein [Hydromonas duriensis]|nr:lysophospholipid acyltransferase family protein [Hydromonas duriensis]